MNGRRLSAILLSALVAAACGSGGPPGSTGATNATPGGGTAGNGGNGEPTAGTGAGSGATIRLINVWGEPDKLGPTVTVRIPRSDPEVVLLTANPGQVTEFVELPTAKFGDGPANVEVLDAGSEDGIQLSNFATGDRVTIIVHGEVQSGGGAPALRVERIWEKGQQAVGVPWPTPGAGTGVIAVFAGPLLALPGDEQGLSIRTEAGECLIDPTFNEPEDGGFGGTGANYLFLPKNEPTTLHVSSRTVSGCVAIDPDIGTAEVDTSSGKRFAVIAWGMSGELELLTVDMGTG